MRIVIIKDGPLFPVRDGASYKICNFALEYQRQGAEVSLFLIDRGWSRPDELRACGLKDVWLLPPDTVYGDRRITVLLEEIRPDVVITNIPELILEKKEEWRGFFVVYDSHDILSQRLVQLRAPLQELLTQEFIDLAACGIADLVLCCSSRDKAAYVARGVPVDKLRVTFNGRLIPSLPRIKRRDEVVFLGHLFFGPNRRAFVKVLDIARRMPDVRFTVIGAYPPQCTQGLPANVCLVGPVDDITASLCRAKVGITPLEIGSGSRVKIVDYLAHGLHVISTGIGAAGLEPLHSVIRLSDDFGEYPKIIRELLTLPTSNRAGRAAVRARYDFRHVVAGALRYLEEARVMHAANRGE